MPVGGDFQEGAPMEGGHLGGDFQEGAPMEGGHFGGDFGEIEGPPQA